MQGQVSENLLTTPTQRRKLPEGATFRVTTGIGESERKRQKLLMTGQDSESYA